MKKVWYGIKSTLSLGVFGVFLVFSSALLAGTIFFIYVYIQSIEHIFQITDETNLFANVEIRLLDQQLAEEAVVGELLVNTPFQTREELENWLGQATACDNDDCQEEMVQLWQASYDIPEGPQFIWSVDDLAGSVEEFCAENPEAPGCAEFAGGQLPVESGTLPTVSPETTLPLPTTIPGSNPPIPNEGVPSGIGNPPDIDPPSGGGGLP